MITIPRAESISEILTTNLQAKITELQARFLPCSLDVENQKNRLLFFFHDHHCKPTEKEVLRQELASCLATFFYECWEHDWIHKKLSKRLPESIHSELDQVEARLMTRRKSVEHWIMKLTDALTDYLKTEEHLALDGFIYFRFHVYRQSIEKLIQEVVEEFILDREYKEFIQLLRYFVSVQTPTYDLVHVIHQMDGKFKLFRNDGTPLQYNEIDQALRETIELSHAYSYEDYIVSALLSTSPEQIILHTKQNEANVIRTLIQIFEERITLCTGCIKCGVSKDGNLSPHS
ncbi:putative sporulation protein YtxC [Seinonella peptonophila]|uniref:Putative sporulation protein YtxC n=1 Tax=Seinonella peptonophila TaxID=112248 RepID=A0A1M4U8C3_9BACL|nr:putative sporulation protein YtxC [Seinonella peptonophila]SHE52924.1 putative sporulation protein YtxC [Seinonella peptonophila]